MIHDWSQGHVLLDVAKGNGGWMFWMNFIQNWSKREKFGPSLISFILTTYPHYRYGAFQSSISQGSDTLHNAENCDF